MSYKRNPMRATVKLEKKILTTEKLAWWKLSVKGCNEWQPVPEHQYWVPFSCCKTLPYAPITCVTASPGPVVSTLRWPSKGQGDGTSIPEARTRVLHSCTPPLRSWHLTLEEAPQQRTLAGRVKRVSLNSHALHAVPGDCSFPGPWFCFVCGPAHQLLHQIRPSAVVEPVTWLASRAGGRPLRLDGIRYTQNKDSFYI